MSSQPFKVKAVFEYTSPHDEDLNFPNGQIITVTEDDEEDWYTGEYVDSSGVKKEGIFPRNFVEKYEPTAPPRPNRAPRPKKDPEVPPAAPVAETPAPKETPQRREVEEDPEQDAEARAVKASPTTLKPASVASSPTVDAPPVATQALPKPVPATSKPAPPPLSEKPTGGSFRDRIAAFNKPAAPPVAPFKPGGMSGQSFIKKPFIAPPPSKNSYVPPPREPAPQKVYRRDEDPEIAARETENQENAEKAGLIPNNEDEAEDQPKPTSLKERIALLQKQQAEQAARHADAAAKKEKPKRPAKKRTDSYNTTEGRDEDDGADLERAESHDTIGKNSMESTREENTAHRGVPPRRKSSRGPPAISRESFGDGNDADMSGAGDETEEPEDMSTGRDDSDDKPRVRAPAAPARAPGAPLHEPDVGEEEGAAEEEELEEDEGEEEEEDIDPEVRRKEELRARMAKMSGGMGMHGMFGGGMPLPTALPPKKKKSTGTERQASEEYGNEEVSSPAARAPPVPGIPLPGMSRMVRSPEESNKQLGFQREDELSQSPISTTRPPHEIPDTEDVKPTPPSRSGTNRLSSGPPPIPGGRPAPPPVPTDSRPTVARESSQLMSASAGSESDDELSSAGQKLSLQTPTAEMPNRGLPPRPPQGAPSVPARPDAPSSPRSPTSKRASYFGNEPSPTSPTTPGAANKRASRLPPPIPGAAPAVSSSQNRAPPPPPPNGPSLSRSSTGDARVLASTQHNVQDDSDEEEVTEYEGDYDTDIASAAPHKDALKSHTRDISLEDDTPVRSPVASPPNAPPRLPPVVAHRALPPPLPSQPPTHNRQSVDMPRGVPPPPPPPKEQIYDDGDDEEYDPYRYTAPKHGIAMPAAPSRRVEEEEEDEDLYSVSPVRSQPPPTQERAAPPPPPRDVASPPSTRAPPRQSMETQRNQGLGRKSTDMTRMSMDSGFVANDVDLAAGTLWWTHPNGIPPVFQNRKDILYESEESTSTKRGGKSITTKDLYVLFQDYSQTIITVRFDPQNPSDASLEQRQEHPPSRLRQDQLEQAYEEFGREIAAAVASKKDTVVGDGTPHGLIQELLKPLTGALLPVGTRAYGALVYANMANAGTSLNDEIRPGDIITLRNARFQGKHGPMHAKYSSDIGNASGGTGHVGVVAEWDGTKKKVRAWEQGREKKKVALESFKLDDLRSGEVKIWRVMPRGWVHWEGQN